MQKKNSLLQETGNINKQNGTNEKSCGIIQTEIQILWDPASGFSFLATIHSSFIDFLIILLGLTEYRKEILRKLSEGMSYVFSMFFLSPVFLLNLSVYCFHFVELCLDSDCLELSL